MKRVTRGAWWYGVSLVLLFTLAAIATRTVIYSVERLIDEQDYETAKQVSTIGIWLLTMGFMFLAAGLGMWAIQYASVRESLRRLGSFIDAMDYLHDGLVALNSKGEVINANPAARILAPRLETAKTTLREAFPCLTQENLQVLTDSEHPHEVECDVIGETTLQTLRFRSQPTQDLPLILISDVTENKAQEVHQREAARLKLIGRIARGVADDFNRILSVISGQTGLLTHLTGGSGEATQAANEIYRAVQTGSSVASHLIDLSRTDAPDVPTDYIEQNLRRSVSLLRLALPPGWSVVEDIARNLPPVNLSGSQVEQAVMNLGLICCDDLSRPGTVKVSARMPGKDHLDNVDPRFALVILISATFSEEEALLDVPVTETSYRAVQNEVGAILSIVRSGIEESGGRLDYFSDDQGIQAFRIAVPKARRAGTIGIPTTISDALQSQLSGKALLLAVAAERGDRLEKMAREINMRATRVHDTVNLLVNIETGAFNAVLLDLRMIEPEASAMLRAITKLRPDLALLVLGPSTQHADADIPNGVRIFPATAPPRALFEAIANSPPPNMPPATGQQPSPGSPYQPERDA